MGPTPGDFFGSTLRLGRTARGTRFSVTAPLYDRAKGLTRVYDILPAVAQGGDRLGDDDDLETWSDDVTFRQVGQDVIALDVGDELEGIMSDDGYHLTVASLDASKGNESHVGHVGHFVLVPARGRGREGSGGNQYRDLNLTDESSEKTDEEFPASQGMWQWKLVASMNGNSSEGDFGRLAVNRNGSVLAISDIQFDDFSSSGAEGLSNVGCVWVYRVNVVDGGLGSWEWLGQRISGTSQNEYFGRRLSISGDGVSVAIGSRDYNIMGVENEDFGKVVVYQWDPYSTGWKVKGQELIGAEKEEKMGTEVELSADGNVLAVTTSSRWRDDTTGKEGVGVVRVYEYDDDSYLWQPMGNDIVSGDTMQLDFGFQLRLSDDGTRLAIGQSKHSPSDKLFEVGRIQVFDYVEETRQWFQVGDDILGERSCDFVGIGFDLSPDGSRLVVGYPNAEGWAEEGPDCSKDGLGEPVKGFVRVFDLQMSQ